MLWMQVSSLSFHWWIMNAEEEERTVGSRVKLKKKWW